MVKRAKVADLVDDDPEMGLAGRLDYLDKPLKFIVDSKGNKTIQLSEREFRKLLHHLRTLITLARSVDEESVSMEEFAAELKASGRLSARR